MSGPAPEPPPSPDNPRGALIGLVFAALVLLAAAGTIVAQTRDSDGSHANDSDSGESHDEGEDGDESYDG